MLQAQSLNWMNNGNCIGVKDREIFFASDKEVRKQRQAKKVCSNCQVRKNCLAWGVETESIGIFGGMTETERNILMVLLRAKRMTLYEFLDTENRPVEQKTHTEMNTSYIAKPEQPSGTADLQFRLVI